MKIGIDARNLTTSMTGIGRYVLEMSRHLALRGHQLYLYFPQPPHGDVRDLPPAQLRVARSLGGVKRMIWAQTELPHRAAQDDLDVFWGPAHRLPRFLDRRIARIVTIHDLVWKDMGATMRWQTRMGDRWLMKPGIAVADAVVAVSKATASVLTAQFPECSEKLDVIYPGMTSIRGAAIPKPLASFGIDRSYILFVGTLEPRKNLLRLLQAYASVPEALRQELLLVLAGGQGWRLGDLKEHIANLHLETSVRLTGYVSDADLAQLYSKARFLAMPSLYEGFGFPIIEANAMGVPVLTSNSSSMPEVAGEAGILVDPDDVRSICGGLEELATNMALYERLAEKAKDNARRFDWMESARQLEYVFAKAIARRSGRRR
ncbi:MULTISPECIES: glycosyltransferase family 1 protein [unclassified Rhizobium]|uniref:glycosyltransferase family 4 protein n=1 Tax=unclassified Rhizobium TaxID=2613769 RepID=UPI00160BF6FA|nr:MULTISPECIES: glycosyltransferase family 1 protein [unclassified Rhizobium]MBB3286300.1 glycosyltransferase involved in cell wall biosynthesis [Rhizobium sp. BK252]MBB3401506.1 glycosyltransferase involved in cell wall biosynthesis [Rhizobium sp. BK289]MBB3414084.1 glycosyltransferase involved in cell wall biosynthesis [Rhizobium sp. BK284]MBB3481971.1 glycosyltransferase involved in cell wall biosynthesis [Rhizobium sp. BK347]